MKSKNRIIKDKQYRGYNIPNGEYRNCNYNTITMDQIIDQTEYESHKHSKSLHIRLDIRNQVDGEEYIGRKDMTRILESTKRNIERKYGSKNKPEMNYVWTTEKEEKPEKCHFHLLVTVNGNAIQNGYAVMDELNKAVMKHIHTENSGLVEFCKSNGKYGNMVNRNADNFEEKIAEVVGIGSYLAKTNTKENRPKGARVSSASKLPKDWRQKTK